jgi:Flp pilus assembly pilin Flp
MVHCFLPLWIRLLTARANAARYRNGQGLVEYALILSLVALVVISILGMLGYILCTDWYLVIVGPGSPFYDPNVTCTS